MSDISARLSLPYLLPSQAQKHVTHNEALRRLDILVQLAVEAFGAVAPPALPQEGQVWALGGSPSGAWAGHGDKLAAWTDGSWFFIAPQIGWQALDKPNAALKIRGATGWESPALPDISNLDGIGVNADYDETNRLSVAAPATLFSHEGAGHQLKINKAAEVDTGSLLFQTGWSGRAEMGTAGSDDFLIKVSADGDTWTTGLVIDAVAGQVTLPAGLVADGVVTGSAVQQAPGDITPGRLARADYAYGRGNLLGPVAQVAGQPTGAALERGTNANGNYTRFADGTQICWVSNVNMGSIVAFGSGTWASPYRTAPVSLVWPAAFAAIPAASLSLGPASTAVPLDARGLLLNTYEPPEMTGWNFIRAARMGSSSFDTDIVLSVMAVGRWF